VLPAEQRRRVVSVIGDSTFVHSGINGLVEMVYNPPPDGHVLILLDNSTTAMTGHQEHPGTGRTLDHQATGKVKYEDWRGISVCGGCTWWNRGWDPMSLSGCCGNLESRELAVIVVRRPCILVARQIKEYERQQQEQECECACEPA
jgi:indolepyruvate ferredoxin oxidoreductase, alpha subunit